MNTAILVDDEPIARLSLRGMLETYFPKIHIKGEAKNLPDAIKLIHQQKPDIIFLDIEMPGYSGLEILDFFNVQQLKSKIIFVTAYEEFALKAFELSAVDYLLKPIQKNALERALSKISSPQQEALQVLQENLKHHKPQKITLQTGEGLLFLKLDDIIYLKADGSYTHFFLSDNEKVIVSKRLLEYEKLLELGSFMRIHRSHIINLDHIKKITKEDGGGVVMSTGELLSISQEKKSELLALFGDQKL
ncbi:LytR/AlgR family response regulator transcription factor [Mongoliitalea daihaiensis]|uniref:LytR/AlgR family response regulator transcription factor n=1 Tax=Mongoliitalea daihaiensis TaxID=2782006 RepID=UPI001F464932|nr:response regulator [Mongoliitalea daihaiensis]UJP64630.1 response regulator [Mongoliitalea daihaiensis]